MMDEAQPAMERIEARIERHPGWQGFGDAIVARLPAGRGPVLVLCDLDTVHAPGVFERDFTFRREG